MNYFYRTICVLIYGVMFLTIFLQPALAQQKNEDKVNINIRNGKLEEIIQAVMKQTSVKIVYNQELVQKSPRQTFIAKNEPLKSVMKRLLKGSALTFVMMDKVMVIAPKEEDDEAAQISNTVKGMVQDDKGNPIPAVTVNVTGTPSTTFTNEKGTFSILLEEGKSLTFSSVGFQKKTIRPKSGEMITVRLESELNEMEEFVVTGYQTVNKRLSASSTYTLKGTEVKEPGATNIVSMLQGKVPGLSVAKNSGSPNAIPSMRMRGTSTLIGNANPIIVVDGIIRENPNAINPDNLLGVEPSSRDMYLMKDGILSKASLTGNSISGLNVNDVESITFLKDASATAIYGTRAANGVIVITTKKGKAGKPEISYSSTLGTSRRPQYSDMQLMNSQQRVRFSREMYQDGYTYQSVPINMGYEGAFMDLMNKKITEGQFQKTVADLEKLNTDWFGILFQNTLNVSQHLSLSGGSEKTSYYSSASYEDNKGTAKEDRLREGSVSVAINSQLNRKLTLNFNLNGSQRFSSGYFSVNPLDYAIQTSRAISPSLVYPSIKEDSFGFVTPLDYNILNEIEQTGSSVKNSQLASSLSLNYLVLRGLTLTSLASGNVNALNSEQYATELSNYVALSRGYNYGSVAPGSVMELNSILPFGGVLLPSNSSVYGYTLRNMAEFNRSIFTENDVFNIVAGQEIRSVKNDGLDNLLPGYLRDRGEGFSMVPNSIPMISPKRTNTLNNFMSLFATASYSYANKYIVNGNIRTDASNRFGQFANQRFLPVWSIAGRWNISSEKWLQNSKIINDLGLKASYGFQGNVISSVGPDLILSIPDVNSALNGGANEFYLNIKSLPYPGLRWEKTKSLNLEMNGSLFNSFLNFNMAYYRKRTTDAITRKFIPLEYGVPIMLVNGGNIKNYGYEMLLGMNLIRRKNLNWRMSVNSAKNFNTLEKGTIETTSSIIADYLSGAVLVEGQSINTFYVFSFKGLNPKTGVPMFKGIDEDGVVPKGSFIDFLKPAGSRDAKISGGLNTSVDYSAFSLGMSFAFKLGSKRLRNPVYKASDVSIPMTQENLPAILEERWRKPGDEAFTDIPAFPKNNGLQGEGFVVMTNETGSTTSSMSRYDMYNHSDANLVSGSFLRCNAINFSYRLADNLVKRMKLKQVSVSGTASNLFVIADKKLRGQDPEIDGVGTTALPISKIFSLGLNVIF
ncbi:SusC/RagA family TonB-linked outer membrane protein [Pedobacter nyackensis]|uniref:TonB-linked outer membrane protein, SusC/RagA family n=1 Tax=Pedobacter nyackensis TaxID=475255 RepID=A0A1W2ACK6_9SPHI|nr:SusC/RagA family TonB-linked outer membrane protein [Pedobacter nyackensis]SMC57968.1 TonB-linked outer membrane protein, SusC/RagA family [Pedobacter nyackensis]